MLTNLRLAQIYAVLRLELKKTFFARRGLWVYLLAFSPLVLFGGHTAQMLVLHRHCDFGLDTNIFATVFQIFYLQLVIFFGCLGIFMNLFRGDILDKSLHFYLLAPIRREVLLAGKFIAGLCASVLIFSTSTIVQFFTLYAHFDQSTLSDYLWRANGIQHLLGYVGVTVMACVGYGAVFLGAGILVRNPIIPAIVILGWEKITPFLPSILKKFSVIYYLKSLCPLEAGSGLKPPLSLIAINPDPIPGWIAVFGLLGLAALLVTWSATRVRKLEISYTTD